MPAEVTTSAIRCRPSARSAGDRSRLPARSSRADQSPFSGVATAFRPIPTKGMRSGRRLCQTIQAWWKWTGGEDDQHAVDHCRKELRLVVAVGMVRIRWNRRQVHRAERHHARDDIDRAFQCVRKQCGAASDPPGRAFQDQYGDTDADTADRNVLAPRHLDPTTPTGRGSKPHRWRQPWARDGKNTCRWAHCAGW